jgi:hypothetical protein
MVMPSLMMAKHRLGPVLEVARLSKINPHVGEHPWIGRFRKNAADDTALCAPPCPLAKYCRKTPQQVFPYCVPSMFVVYPSHCHGHDLPPSVGLNGLMLRCLSMGGCARIVGQANVP